MSAPVAPIGCPSEMPEPFGFTFAGSSPSSLLTAQACAAKASLASTRSRSDTFSPAFSSALREAGTGPMPMIFGSTPACAYDTNRASGFSPRRSASARSISTSAAAASFRPEALPAVTEPPSFLNAGLSLLMSSSLASMRTCSSVSNITVPLRPTSGTGTICSLKRPCAMACCARRWLSSAASSCCARLMSNCAATFSAVTPMWMSWNGSCRAPSIMSVIAALPMRAPQRMLSEA